MSVQPRLAIALVALLALPGCGVFNSVLRPNLETEQQADAQARNQAWYKDMRQRADDLKRRIDQAPPDQYEALEGEAETFIAELKAGIPEHGGYSLSDEPGLIRKRLEGLANKSRVARWREISVVSRLGMSPDDSARLDKVQEAYSKTSPELLVTVVEKYTVYQPTPKHEVQHSFRLTPAAERDYQVEWRNDTWVSIALPQRSRPLPTGRTALVWDTDGSRATLVTPSGGRYYTGNIGAVAEIGAQAAAGLSAEGEHHYLAPSDIELLESSGQLPSGSLAQLSAAIEQTEKCAARYWNAARGEIKAIELADLRPTTRKNRLGAVKGKVRKAVRKSCDRHLAKTASLYEQLMTRWKSARAGVLSAVQTRLSSR